MSVLTRYEPCATFVDHHDEPGVCSGCAWLAGDHATEREATLTRIVRRPARPVRALAS